MIEVVDLLYKNPHELIKTPNQEESMKHLLLEEVINGATVNPQLQQDIYDLISVPEPDPENIIWRRDILDDFLSNPALFDDLRAILGIHDEISKGMRNAARGGGTAVVSKKELTGRDSQIFKMRSYAECIVRTIEMYEEAANNQAAQIDIRSVLQNKGPYKPRDPQNGDNAAQSACKGTFRVHNA